MRLTEYAHPEIFACTLNQTRRKSDQYSKRSAQCPLQTDNQSGRVHDTQPTPTPLYHPDTPLPPRQPFTTPALHRDKHIQRCGTYIARAHICMNARTHTQVSHLVKGLREIARMLSVHVGREIRRRTDPEDHHKLRQVRERHQTARRTRLF